MFNESHCLNSGRVLAEDRTGRCWTPCFSVIGCGLLFCWEVSANLLTIQSWNLKLLSPLFSINSYIQMSAPICVVITVCFHASALPGRLSPATYRCLAASPFHCILRPSSSQQPCTGSKLQGLSLPEEQAWTPENDIQNLPQPAPTYPLSFLSHRFKKYLLSICTEYREEGRWFIRGSCFKGGRRIHKQKQDRTEQIC